VAWLLPACPTSWRDRGATAPRHEIHRQVAFAGAYKPPETALKVEKIGRKQNGSKRKDL
jgi:hypothetical protein